MPPEIPGQKLIGPIGWDKIFADWRTDEATQQAWIDHYTKNGYASWEEWRSMHTSPLRAAARDWFQYQLIDPVVTAPEFKLGLHRSWVERYCGGERGLTFAQLASRGEIRSNRKVIEITQNFPSPTQLIGLWHKESLYMLEGMHRCSALALIAADGMSMTGTVTVAATDISNEELPLLSAVQSDGGDS